jgi:EAL domain-containing protein (putative c-di-GMP-specific phosphodiesterase class I)
VSGWRLTEVQRQRANEKACDALGQPRDSTERFNLLLLSGDPAWSFAVNQAAGAMGIGRLHTTDDPREAVVRLAGGFPPVSHLLMDAGSAGALLPQLVDLTAGESPYGIAMVVLGDAGALAGSRSAAAMTFVPATDAPAAGRFWLQRVLAAEHGRSAAGQERLSLPELRDALNGARIQTRYQPIVRMSDGHPIGLEVLARLEHPSRGILQPDLFVPQIEEAGLAWPLTEAVVRRAFEDWGHGRLAGFGLTLALNFPLDVLLIPEALTWLEARRHEAEIPAECLVIELTESRPVSEIARLRHAIATLRNLGYGLAIDDVGPEIRDHNALLDLQFTALKLDKDLVRESPDSPSAAAFLDQTIAAAREAGLVIVAEGVEDADIWARMKALGVDQAQGFLVARPLPAAAVPLWHRDWCARLRG